MKEFIHVIILDHYEEHDIFCHYSQIYKFNETWYWNEKEIVNRPEYIEETLSKFN